MNNKIYWQIGTSAEAFIKKFANMVNDNDLSFGTTLIISKDECSFSYVNGEPIKVDINSKNTLGQYLTVWEAFNFIYRKENHYIVATPFRDKNTLTKLAEISIFEIKDRNEKIITYIKSLVINVLIIGKAIKFDNLIEKGYFKKKGDFTINSINRSVGRFEKDLAKQKETIKKYKEWYDKEF